MAGRRPGVGSQVLVVAPQRQHRAPGGAPSRPAAGGGNSGAPPATRKPARAGGGQPGGAAAAPPLSTAQQLLLVLKRTARVPVGQSRTVEIGPLKHLRRAAQQAARASAGVARPTFAPLPPLPPLELPPQLASPAGDVSTGWPLLGTAAAAAAARPAAVPTPARAPAAGARARRPLSRSQGPHVRLIGRKARASWERSVKAAAAATTTMGAGQPPQPSAGVAVAVPQQERLVQSATRLMDTLQVWLAVTPAAAVRCVCRHGAPTGAGTQLMDAPSAAVASTTTTTCATLVSTMRELQAVLQLITGGPQQEPHLPHGGPGNVVFP